jgi:1,4-dihydroxy-2-naphthoyl-CoA hydrolase
MAIWTNTRSVEQLNQLLKGTMCEHVGMEITEVGADYLRARLPVDDRTRQHMGIIHGGASVVLAETIGSIAAGMCCPAGHFIVGLEVNANHVRAGRPPYLTGTARPLHIGNSTMVWDIRIVDVDDKLVCVSRLTTSVLKQRADQPELQPLPGMQEQAQQ